MSIDSIKWTKVRRKAAAAAVAVGATVGLGLAAAPAAHAYQFNYGQYYYPSTAGKVGVKIQSPNGYTKILYPGQDTVYSEIWSRAYIGTGYCLTYHWYNGSNATIKGPTWGAYTDGQEVVFNKVWKCY